jgi:hypothetical protein
MTEPRYKKARVVGGTWHVISEDSEEEIIL